MTGERNLNATDHYAHELADEIMPGSQVLISPMDSSNVTKGTYVVMTPDDQLGLLKFAIPPDHLRTRADPQSTYDETKASLKREAKTIGSLKAQIKENAERLVEKGHYAMIERPGATKRDEPVHYRVHPPSIWVPEIYAADEKGFIREWIAGQHVTSIDELVADEVRTWARDVATVSELFGYAGFDALAMNGKDPAVDGRSIQTTFVRHHSPYADSMVISPTDYASLVHVTDPSFRNRQNEDFRQAMWLIALAEKSEASKNRPE